MNVDAIVRLDQPVTRAPALSASHATVYLVGAGPGAADLLTVRAARLLAQAEIVLHDALVTDDVLALAPQARLVAVGKRCGKNSSAQSFINKQLLDAAGRYRTVVRLKGGDPMLFGRAQEEISHLATAGIRVEVVPGISAAFGASASLLQSLTQRGKSRSVTLLTPAIGTGEAGHDWAATAASADTAVLYMAGRQAERVAEGLCAAGVAPTTPAVLIENATLPGERVHLTTVAHLGESRHWLGEGPVLMLVGEVYRSVQPNTQASEERWAGAA